ncbi:exosortase/archaeosortase family protein [Algibacter sp. L1A34]|uniref:exosortase/archaeosortase family protein n=1 Tax=Algibacter sp. L1A34 TaxID=2686365 RepID=UPI00131E68F3|nr:exosortase/archaeosortase family protein [Algibacter sp. L1A34]
MLNLKSILKDIPLPIRLFLGKALLLFIIWKVIYSGFMYDSQYLDHPLTTHVAEASASLLNNIGMSGFTSKREKTTIVFEGAGTISHLSAIYHDDYKTLNIANACNGLEIFVLYIGFIICMPSTFWRKTKYIVLGILILDAINILRCVGLIYLIEYFEVYFDFAHHYLFKAMVYTTTLIIWGYFARKIHLKNETVQIG